MNSDKLFILTAVLVFLSIAVESLSLLFQLSNKRLTKWFKDNDFNVHAGITVLFWTGMTVSFVFLQFKQHPDFYSQIIFLRIIGLWLLTAGLVISVWGFLMLGLKRSLGINFFRADVPIVNKSIYKYMNNPETIGLCTALFGFALFTGSVYNLIIAIEFTVLMIPHTKLENIPVKH
ncbi:MAG: methyltransferase [Elusimicrobiota bacterium]